MPYLFAILSAAGYGLNDLCIHLGMRSGKATSNQALIINLISGNVLLAVVAAIVYFTAGFPALNWAGMIYFVAAGLAAPFLGRIFSISSIKRIGATRTTALRVSDTFFTMLLALVMLRDAIPFVSLIGAVVLVAGVVMLVNEMNRSPRLLPAPTISSDADETLTDQTGPTKTMNLTARVTGSSNPGVFFALTAAFFFAVGGVLRQFALENIPSAILGTVVGSFVALVTNGITTYFSGQLRSSCDVPRRDAFFFALGGFGNTMGMLMFFLALMAGGSVSVTAALKNTSPLFTLFLSWLFLRKAERFNTRLILSIFLVITGAFLIVIE